LCEGGWMRQRAHDGFPPHVSRVSNRIPLCPLVDVFSECSLPWYEVGHWVLICRAPPVVPHSYVVTGIVFSPVPCGTFRWEVPWFYGNFGGRRFQGSTGCTASPPSLLLNLVVLEYACPAVGVFPPAPPFLLSPHFKSVFRQFVRRF